MNAQHAKEHADCGRAQTLALFQKGAATPRAVVGGLNDDQLEKSATVFTDAPRMTAEQLIMRGLLGHLDEHMGAFRKPPACDADRPRHSVCRGRCARLRAGDRRLEDTANVPPSSDGR